jgi:hypothetical protein
MRKNNVNPIITYMNTINSAPFSIDSGIKCRNAPPIKAPADNATSDNNIFSRNLSLSDNVNIPTREPKLIMNVLSNI